MTTQSPIIPLVVYVVFQRLAPREVPQRSIFAGLGYSKQSSRSYPNYRRTIRELELDAAPELVSWRGKSTIPGKLLTHRAGCNRSPRRLIVRADYIFPMAAPMRIDLVGDDNKLFYTDYKIADIGGKHKAGPSNKRLSSWVDNAKGRLTRAMVAKNRQKYRALGLRNHSPREAPIPMVDLLDTEDWVEMGSAGYAMGGRYAKHKAGKRVYFRTKEIVQMYKGSAPRHSNSISPVHTHGVI